MRNFLFLVLGLILMTFCIDAVMPANDGQSREEVIKDFVNRAGKKYHNCDMGRVPYIDIMYVDRERSAIGYVAFVYDGYTDIEIECWADSVRYNYTGHIDIGDIAERDNAETVRKCCGGYILAGTLRGPDGVSVQGYNYYRKYVCRNGRWIAYGVNYKYNDKDSLARLFAMVDGYV